MPPNQDKTSNGKKIEQIIAHNYFVVYSCIESTHRPGSDTTLKIAKRKRYKNAVDGVVLAAIQIAEDPI